MFHRILLSSLLCCSLLVGADPYLWLEDENSTQTQAWVAQRDALTDDYLAATGQRETIATRLQELTAIPRYSVPKKRGDTLYFLQRDAQTDHFVLQAKRGNTIRTVIDRPGLEGYSISPNGQYLAFGISEGGSDWHTWQVQELLSGKAIGKPLSGLRFGSPTWAADSKGLYYSRDSNEQPALQQFMQGQQLYYRSLQGTEHLLMEREGSLAAPDAHTRRPLDGKSTIP